ncbi:MAG: hypothetical protein KDA75_12670, partial [Planctomycetaceae bacterium]|nr:hypothetical protein [Planctomycetaceae bacterium]
MTTTPATPTDVTATTAPGASVHIGGAASSHVAPPGRSAALRSELEAIVTRLPEAGQRRAALLEVMLRQRRIVGGVWFDLGHEQPQAVLTRLPGPALDRTTLRAWITSVAQGLDRQGGIAEFPCPQIRNLTALAISVRQEKSTEAV